MNDRYEQPELSQVCVNVELGFFHSGTIDNMHETNGNWE